MISIQFPSQPFKIKKEGKAEFIFDEIRKRWLSLTPEEWVRQNIIQFLVVVKNYPSALFAIEKVIILGDLKKRCDVIIYDRNAQPWMIIECKEQRVPIDVKVLDQILRYHSSVPVPFLIITNGKYCFGFEKREDNFFEIDEFPEFKTV